MINNSFANAAATEGNENYDRLCERLEGMYKRDNDLRSDFARDYTRLLHSRAYRRLKHKTQVFYNINNDHICTRMEHVAHVESVSYTIAKNLGLNEELTRAIAIGHDVGHPPFGHEGETVLSGITEKYLGKRFWHEQNSLRFIDELELLEGPNKKKHNLNLTYAVRDGIISHCGEVNENHLFPRKEFIDLRDFTVKGRYMPATWEGCVVKVSDKIAYLGRDIEDALSLGFIDDKDKELLNTTIIINNLVTDLCENSSLDKGICFSAEFLQKINELKANNYRYIYNNPRFDPYIRYCNLVITEIFEALKNTYENGVSWDKIESEKRYNPILMTSFKKWLLAYSGEEFIPEEDREMVAREYDNVKVYKDPNEFLTYIQAIIDYIAGMTDRFAVKVFNEMLEF